jgi:hypothetical protein
MLPDLTLPSDKLADHELGEGGFSVADLRRRWKVGAGKIHGFLRRGESIGVNLATNLAARPQYRITRESVEAFERRRSSAPPLKQAWRRRRQVLVDFYPD